jgi:AcrR family transcriptional regulator
MGIKERHERDREAVRRGILDAARELFVSEGFRNVSIRKIAERIEYSPAAIYGYFPSKDDIFFALAEEGFRLLGDPGAAPALDELNALDPMERLRVIFMRLHRFSREHPQYFALMFVERSVPRISREYERFAFAREIKRHLVDHIQSCIDAGLLPPSVKPFVAIRLLTMSIVGLATLSLSDRLAPTEDPDTLARDAVNVILAGLRTGVALESTEQQIDCPSPNEAADLHPFNEEPFRR